MLKFHNDKTKIIKDISLDENIPTFVHLKHEVKMRDVYATRF